MRNSCPICRKQNKTITDVIRDKVADSKITKYKISFQICQDCNFYYQAPEMSDDFFNDIYSNHYVGNIEKQYSRFEKNKEFRLSSIQNFFKYINNSNDFSILEIGSSSGYNLSNIVDNFDKVVVKGVDLDKGSVEYGKTLGINLSTENAFELKEKFDIVFINHVLEHIIDFELFINNSLKLLKHNGKLVINVPNSELWGEQPYWEHVNYFSEPAMIKVMEKMGISKYEIYSEIIHKKLHRVPEIRLIIHSSTNIINERHTAIEGAEIMSIRRSKIRNRYDKTSSKSEMNRLTNLYNANKKGRTLFELLFWSKLYRFFTFKKISKK